MIPLPDLALIEGGDSYLVELEDDVDRNTIRVLRVLMFPGNTNIKPEIVPWNRVLPGAKFSIVRRINRKYTGKLVKPVC